MQRYLGIDVHADSSSLCVVDERGRTAQRDVVETNGDVLVRYVQLLRGPLSVCFEESEWAPWLWETLSPHVAEVVVVHGKRGTGSKSDAIDAHGLAERLRTGQVGTPIFKAPRQFSKLRELAQVYGLLTKDLTRTKNRVKSRFRRRGLECRGEELYQPEERARRMLELPVTAQLAVELLGAELDTLAELKARAEAAMVEEAHRHRVARRLEAVPGLGPVRVAQILPIVVTPHRFRTKRQFWAYCGLGIVTRSSSDWVQIDGQWVKARTAQTRGLNRNFNRTLKSVFKGAASSVIGGRCTNPFRQAYQRLCDQGTKPNLAKLTIARKIAATTLAIWKTGEEYDPKR